MNRSPRRSVAEIGAVLLTGGLFLVFENVLSLKLEFLVPCIALWTAYLAYRLTRERGVAEAWGLRPGAIRAALPSCALLFAVGALGLLSYRWLAGWQPLPAGAAWIFLLYPIWAFIQEFVVQALVAGNLERLGVARGWIVPVAAILFGVAHAPDWALAGLCAVAGLAWTWLFLRGRSLYPLALTHAWLGALAYYWVFERDPWFELFARG